MIAYWGNINGHFPRQDLPGVPFSKPFGMLVSIVLASEEMTLFFLRKVPRNSF
ncbi:MAG: hypothetical protein ACJAQ2_001502 [Vicingaceae bacterium]